MKKTFRYYFISIVLICLILFSSAVSAGAAGIPNDSYTYWSEITSERKAVYNRPMYELKSVLNAGDMGVSDFTSISDVCVDSEGKIYILDKESRIVVLNSDFSLLREIGELNSDEDLPVNYSEAASIHIRNDGSIYISDTNNARVLRITQEGTLIDIYTLPDSHLIPDDFEFRPLRIEIDSKNNTYILSDGSYYGALLFDTEMQFIGFFGANNVTTSISSVIKNITDRMFPNNVKKSASVRSLPFTFVDFVIDKNDFVYTATGKTTTYDRTGQIKKLSPGTGNNILDSENVIFTDDKMNTTYNNGTAVEQDIAGIAVDENGFIYCLESNFGKIYLYDNECNLLTAFGGGLSEGIQKGSFIAATALALSGDDIIVADSQKNTLTVFAVNDYGILIKELITLTKNGDYLEAMKGWESALAMDSCFQPAHSGLARGKLTLGEFKESMRIAREGYDRKTYALAFEMYRQSFLSEYFLLFFILVIVLTAALVVLCIATTRKKIRFVKSEQLHLMLTTPIHPIRSFENIKDKHRGSLLLCGILLVLFYISSILQVLCGGFLFTEYDPATFNSLWVLIRSAGLIILWIFSNWMICTLLQGKGRLKEICIVTCYSLTPIIIQRLLSLVLSNILLPAEAVFLSGLEAIAVIYSLALIVMGLIKIHDFSLSRLVGTSVLSIGCVAALVLLIILISMLFQQLVGFIITVAVEIIS